MSFGAPQASKSLGSRIYKEFDSGSGEAGSEVVSHEDGRLYTTNGAEDRIDIFDAATGDKAGELDLSGLPNYGGVTSVAVKNGIVAVAVVGADSRGQVALFDAETLELIKTAKVGFLPDMVRFSSDGSQIYIANEGERGSGGDGSDPKGSVSIIDVSDGGEKLKVTNVDFTSFNSQKDALQAEGVRYFPGVNAGRDWEPEYIAIDPETGNLLVTLQEANAVAVIDPETKSVLDILPLGTVDHNLEGNELDGSDEGGAIDIRNWDVLGLRMPDAIAAFSVGGETYFATANEGDSRDFDESRVEDVTLDPDAYPDASIQDPENLGRLTISNIDGDTDGDGDIDQLYSYGSRSFTIYDAEGNVVFESGSDFQRIIADLRPAGAFNNEEFDGTNPNVVDDNRSDNKGPEPEAIAIGEVDGHVYAFIGLERDGGIMIYDVTDPAEATFVDYIDGLSGDGRAPEVIQFIAATDSPNGRPMIAVSYEISGTTTLFELAPSLDTAGTGDDDALSGRFGHDTLNGRGGEDTLKGAQGDDLLQGGADNDVLIGGAGKDTLIGSAGDDTLTGGAAADVFRFRADAGEDRVEGFAGGDRIEFKIGGLDFADLDIGDDGDGALIDYGSGTILVAGVLAADLTEDRFLFG